MRLVLTNGKALRVYEVAPRSQSKTAPPRHRGLAEYLVPEGVPVGPDDIEFACTLDYTPARRSV